MEPLLRGLGERLVNKDYSGTFSPSDPQARPQVLWAQGPLPWVSEPGLLRTQVTSPQWSSPSVSKHCSPRLVARPGRTGPLLRGAVAAVPKPSAGVQTACAPARWAAGRGSAPSLDPELWPLDTHLGLKTEMPPTTSLTPCRIVISLKSTQAPYLGVCAPSLQPKLTSSCILSRPLPGWGGRRLCPEPPPTRVLSSSVPGRRWRGPGPISLGVWSGDPSARGSWSLGQTSVSFLLEEK